MGPFFLASVLGLGIILALLLPPQPKDASAQQAAGAEVKKVYEKRCSWCHGLKGDGRGPAVEFLNPPPRDFTSGIYKYKSTPHDEILPMDEDLFRMIKGGMAHTSMPGWGGLLGDKEVRSLVAYIKEFAGAAEKPSKKIDFSGKISSSTESIAKGKTLFEDRCSECHGLEGRGDGIKKLKDDAGFRTWPRNLTRPWTFWGGSSAEDIFARVSTGIPNTQMPNFADPASKKKLSPDERWHVVNYVTSLYDESKKVREGETVLRANYIDGELPYDPAGKAWAMAQPVSFPLVPQIIAQERLFTPTNDSITARAIYNPNEIAILLEWDDRTKSIPGDKETEELSEGKAHQDAIAVQFPLKLKAGPKKPYFGHGDATNGVEMWLWRSGTAAEKESVQMIKAFGLGRKEATPASAALLKGAGIYHRGKWKVIFKRALSTPDKMSEAQFEKGVFIPVAFANWDGSNGEAGSKHTLTTWYWLFLEPSVGKSVYAAPLAILAAVFGLEVLISKKYRKNRI